MSPRTCRAVLLNYFIFSGNQVICLIKCRHCSLVFPTFWNSVLWPTGCKCQEHSSHLCGGAWGLPQLASRHPFTSIHCSLWHLTLCPRASAYLRPLSLSELPSLPAFTLPPGAAASPKLATPFDPNPDGDKWQTPSKSRSFILHLGWSTQRG